MGTLTTLFDNMSMKYDPSIDIGANESNEVFLEALREANEAAKPNPELIKQIQLEGWDSSFYDEPSIKEVIIKDLKILVYTDLHLKSFKKQCFFLYHSFSYILRKI